MAMFVFAESIANALLLVSLYAQVGPVPGTQQVSPIYEMSDLVCSCTVQAITSKEESTKGAGAAAAQRRVRATVAVRDAFKNSWGSQGSITLEYTETVRNGVSIGGSFRLSPGENAILFLRSQNGTYTFADRFLGAISFSDLPLVTGKAGMDKLQAVLSRVALGENREDQTRALRLLEGFDNPTAESLSSAEHLSRSADPEVAFAALSVMLRSKSRASVQHLVTYLDSYSSNYEPLSLSTVGTYLGQVNTREALQEIEKLSASRFLSIRLGAMDALRSIKDRKSIPVLVNRLDDPNSMVQYFAVISLAEILGREEGDYAPSLYLFDKRPQYYTALWKQWWQEQGSALEQPKASE